MKLDMSKVILQKRKEKQITQQQLADFVGVSKASVSKWENGQTYPDITLLPLLASYFDITVDQLLSYSNNLSAEQIRKIYQSLANSFKDNSPEKVYKSFEEIIHRYYSCAPLILEMGQFLVNHGDLFPGNDKKDKAEKYLTEAQDLFQRVFEISNDPELLAKAKNFSAYCSLVLQKPDEVLHKLGQYVPEYYPVESLIAWAYQLKGENDKAVATTQSALFQYIAVMMSQLTNYLQLVINQPQKFLATYQRGKQIIVAFSVKKLNPTIVINFLTSASFGFAQTKNDEMVKQCLSEYVDLLEDVKFPLKQHGDQFFDQIGDWLAQTDLGDVLPRSDQQLKTDFVTIITQNPTFMSYQNNEEFKEIFERLERIKENLNE